MNTHQLLRPSTATREPGVRHGTAIRSRIAALLRSRPRVPRTDAAGRRRRPTHPSLTSPIIELSQLDVDDAVRESFR